MRHGSGTAQFDLSDADEVHPRAPRDRHHEVLEVAARKLGELGGESSDDVARLARWTLHNAGAPVDVVRAGSISRYDVRKEPDSDAVDGFVVWRVGSVVGLGDHRIGETGWDGTERVRKLSPEKVRELMSALACALDEAEADAAGETE